MDSTRGTADHDEEAAKGKDAEKKKYRKEFSQKLKTLREQVGRSQAELAAEIGLSTQSIVNYEGTKSLPDAFTLKRLARVFDVPPNELVEPGMEKTKLREPLDAAVELLTSARELGVVGVYRSRTVALGHFQEQIKAETKSIYIVASSIRGLWECPGMKEILRDRVKAKVKIQVVLTAPLLSFLRESIESRGVYAIKSEIEDAYKVLTSEVKLSPGNIKFFPGPPTVFLIATSSGMLLNPYTCGTVAYHTLCIEVEKRFLEDSVYEVYLGEHFWKAWENSVTHQKAVADWARNKGWVETGKRLLERGESTARHKRARAKTV